MIAAVVGLLCLIVGAVLGAVVMAIACAAKVGDMQAQIDRQHLDAA